MIHTLRAAVSRKLPRPGALDPERAPMLLREALEHGRPMRARAVGATGAGVNLEVAGVVGFARRADLPWIFRRDPLACVGETLTGMVMEIRADGAFRLSPLAAQRERLEAAHRARRRVRGRVLRANGGGLVLSVGGMRAFLPRSHMTARQHRRYPRLVGRRWRGYVFAVRRDEIIVSSRRR